ncbi:MAG: hypothetical protein ACK5Z2_19855, partial [Bacteroidota bacterium]
ENIELFKNKWLNILIYIIITLGISFFSANVILELYTPINLDASRSIMPMTILCWIILIISIAKKQNDKDRLHRD